MTELITSTQNNRVKLAHQLQAKARLRRKERKIVLEGVRLVSDAIAVGQRPIFVLYTAQHADYELIALLQDRSVDLLPVSDDVMRYMSDTQNPQGIIGVFPLPAPNVPEHPQSVLILDAIQEPGNMGTILRTAAAAGVQVVILGPGCVDPYNPKVLRSGMGAHFRIPIFEASWAEIRTYCEDRTVFLAAGDGDLEYTEADWLNEWALIIGNEAHGVSNALPGQRILIPMADTTESLNAAVATGVILFEAQRQKKQNGA